MSMNNYFYSELIKYRPLDQELVGDIVLPQVYLGRARKSEMSLHCQINFKVSIRRDLLALWKTVRSAGEPFLKFLEILENDLDSRRCPLSIQCERLCLILHTMSLNPPRSGFAIPLECYFDYTLEYGSLFTEFVKKGRSLSLGLAFTEIISSSIREQIEDMNKTGSKFGFQFNTTQQYEYDSWVHESVLPFWEEEINDFPWAFEPLETDPSMTDIYSSALEELLDEIDLEVQSPTDLEKRRWVSDSIVWKDGRKGILKSVVRRLPESEWRDLTSIHNSTPLKFYRGKVPVCPGNGRDTWQCELSTLFKIKIVSYLLRQIVSKIEFSGMTDFETFTRRKEQLVKKNCYFFMLDFKKCGLTVNRFLLTEIGRIAERKWPGKGFHLLNLWSDVEVSDHENLFYPQRGVGLGNCNEGITLLQCVLGHILKSEFGTDSLFFNDDGIIELNNTRRIEQIQTCLSLYKGLGMILNHKKTIVSRNAVFCESYTTKNDLDYSKKQLLIIEWTNIFFKDNICRAKDAYYNFNKHSLTWDYEFSSSSLVSRYGYEFHESEYSWPYEFGGWRVCREGSYNDSLQILFSKEGTSYEKGCRTLLRKWVHYLVEKEKLSDLQNSSNLISYRVEKLPFGYRNITNDVTEEVGKYLSEIGEFLDQEILELEVIAYNSRGLHNAKPKIKSGIASRWANLRRSAWKEFKLSLKREHHTISPTLTTVEKIIRQTKGSLLSSGVIPPRFLLGEMWFPRSLKKLGNVLYPRLEQRRVDAEGLRCTLDFLINSTVTGKIKISEMSKLLISKTERPVISRLPFFDTGASSGQSWIRCFFGSRRRFFTMVFHYYGMVPYKLPVLSGTRRNYFSSGDVVRKIESVTNERFFPDNICTPLDKRLYVEDFELLLPKITLSDRRIFRYIVREFRESYRKPPSISNGLPERGAIKDIAESLLARSLRYDWGHEYSELSRGDNDLIDEYEYYSSSLDDGTDSDYDEFEDDYFEIDNVGARQINRETETFEDDYY